VHLLRHLVWDYLADHLVGADRGAHLFTASANKKNGLMGRFLILIYP
jgi:hypothetical protein